MPGAAAGWKWGVSPERQEQICIMERSLPSVRSKRVKSLACQSNFPKGPEQSQPQYQATSWKKQLPSLTHRQRKSPFPPLGIYSQRQFSTQPCRVSSLPTLHVTRETQMSLLSTSVHAPGMWHPHAQLSVLRGTAFSVGEWRTLLSVDGNRTASGGGDIGARC